MLPCQGDATPSPQRRAFRRPGRRRARRPTGAAPDGRAGDGARLRRALLFPSPAGELSVGRTNERVWCSVAVGYAAEFRMRILRSSSQQPQQSRDRRSDTLRVLCATVALLATVGQSTGAQRRVPDRLVPTASSSRPLRVGSALSVDSSRRSFTPPRRYLVAVVIGAVVGSRVALHYARTTEPENDPTYGIGSTARAIPIIFVGTVAGAVGGVTIVWLVDSVRRPPR